MREPVYKILDDMNIEYEITEHPAVFTVEEVDALDLDRFGKGTKNLFLRDDKKRNFYIVTICSEKRADLKDLRRKLGSRPLTFASEELLYEHMKLTKGSVTPFGVINDAERKVTAAFDEDVFKFDRIGAHPNDNTATIWVNPYDLKRAIEKIGNETVVIAIG